jgi:hypothetical protein
MSAKPSAKPAAVRQSLISLGLIAVGSGVAWSVLYFTRECVTQRVGCLANALARCPGSNTTCWIRSDLTFLWLLPAVLVAGYWLIISRKANRA